MSALLLDPVFSELKAYVIDCTGLAFYAARETELATHLARRMTATRAESCQSYLALLKQETRELDALIAELTIGETYFFRYTEQFTALRDVVLPHLITRNRAQGRLRVWSAGCATGAEPYSLSILMRRDLALQLSGWDITIIGTDINRDFLARAQSGVFGDWAFRGVPPEVRDACFTRQGDQWFIDPRYREGVSFQYHNLVRHPFPSLLDGLASFDLILCRNVFIYFAFEPLRKMVQQFAHCLVDGGWLLVGHAESNVELFRDFRTVSVPGAILYQKTSTPDPAPPEWEPSVLRSAGAGDHGAPEGVSPPAHEMLAHGMPAHDMSVDEKPAPWAGGPPALRGTGPPALPGTVREDMASLRVLLDTGQWAAAEQVCRKLLAINGLEPSLHFHLSLILEHNGQAEAAQKSLRQALYLDRNFVLAHYHLGLHLSRQGDRTGAKRSFQNARRLLERMAPGHVPDGTDGLTAANLQELVTMHLELL